MSLDVYLYGRAPVFQANITHNLIAMAREAGIATCLWDPGDIDIEYARQLIGPLRAGIALMKADPVRFKAFDSSNGWGLYENFVPWLERYLAACEENPDAEVVVSR
jgi:hypothetical protein